MKILYYGYRDWAIDIFSKIESDNKYLITNDDYDIIDNIKPDLIFFIGWSSLIPEDIVCKYKCICLHPSPLPKYRGGSPIQNQIINGEEKGAVSLFIMDKGLDTGDIIFQEEISLLGDLNVIFDDIKKSGQRGINFIIKNHKIIDDFRIKQHDEESSFYKRRNPCESEITIDEIINNDAIYLYNKIRSLNDPYPNAFIKCKDGQKLYLLKSRYK